MEAYLDNSSTTKQYDEVTRLMLQMMEENYGNPSSLHRKGLAAETMLKKSRTRVAEALGVAPGELVFTSGGTEADGLALNGTAEARKRDGQKIITSKIEHPAVLETFRHLETLGYKAVYIDVDREGFVDLQQLAEQIDDDTILVSIMHVNNETGAVQPLEKIGALKKQAVFHSDCVQSFGKLTIPVSALDMASISGHKIHGPKGIGALYIRRGIRVLPVLRGGGQENDLRSGTENMPAVAGFGLAAEISASHIEENGRKTAGLRDLLKKGIVDQIADVRVNTPARDAVPGILNVSFLGTRGEVILHSLEQDGIYVSTGSACSSHKKGQSNVLTAMGLAGREIEGALRFSISHLNTESEIEYTVEKLKKAVAGFRKLGSFR